MTGAMVAHLKLKPSLSRLREQREPGGELKNVVVDDDDDDDDGVDDTEGKELGGEGRDALGSTQRLKVRTFFRDIIFVQLHKQAFLNTVRASNRQKHF